jgi:FkbM family methyltransferase|tara:strand:+ start:8103 stop:8717 length:615 start_codon:yes stop_codon:yes gene_type:complete
MLLNLKNLHDKYELNVKGVLHIGAHYGEENSIYDELNYPNRIFFEPLKKNFDVLRQNVTEWPLVNIALGASTQNKEMYVESANNGQSSSLLKPKLHLQQYPHITFPEKEDVLVDTLDNVLEDKESYNFINMDVQGYELEVLKGATESLKHIDYLMCEVNRAEVYEECCMIDELDSFLSSYNFKRVETTWDGVTWGDAFYVKEEV